MGHLIAVVLSLTLQAEGAPVKVWTGSEPSGACVGTRVVITATTGKTYACSSGTWTLVIPRS